jgi:hypothetical protein
VVETRSVIGIADVHAGAFAYCIKAFQNLDGFRVICVVARGSCHAEHIAADPAKPKEISAIPRVCGKGRALAADAFVIAAKSEIKLLFHTLASFSMIPGIPAFAGMT